MAIKINKHTKSYIIHSQKIFGIPMFINNFEVAFEINIQIIYKIYSSKSENFWYMFKNNRFYLQFEKAIENKYTKNLETVIFFTVKKFLVYV